MTRRALWLASAAGALLAAGCLVLVNLLGSRFHARLDLSSDRLYSLSPGSKRLLKELKDPVEIRVYFSKDLPPEYAANRAYVADLLAEYRQASRGRIRTRLVDVDKDAQEALEQGIAPVEFNVFSREKFEVRQGFMGLVLQHEDRKEVLPVLTQTAGLEYDLTSRILHLTRPARAVVGILTSHGAMGPEALPGRLREELERRYELRPVDLPALKPGELLPEEMAGLLVLGPTEKLADYHLYTLDQFLMSGRPAAFALDSRRADMRSFTASALDTGLPKLLKSYGVSMRANYVLDAQSQKVQVAQQRGWITFTNIVEYPLFVVATALGKEHPVTRHLDSLPLPLVSALEVGPEAQVLARSSPYSWQRAAWGRGAFHTISPLAPVRPEEEDPKGPFVLAAALSGRLRSHFKEPVGEADPKAFRPESPDGARLLVVGTSRFADPEMPGGEAGAAFLLNVMDWMALDSDLIAIRSKGAVFRPLREIPAPYKTAVRWANILLPSFLAMGAGFLRYGRRRRMSRRRLELYRPQQHAAANA